VRSELRSVDTDTVGMTAMIKRFEEALARVSGNEHTQLEYELTATKQRLAILERRRGELGSDEATLAQEIALEQGRWTAVNDQLEQLERSLTGPERK
jgi:hypothetical protein